MPSQSKPLKFFSVTIGSNHHELISPQLMDGMFDELHLQSWCYQGEYGDQLDKKHYQCRMIFNEFTMKGTLLHIFDMHGIPKEDVHICPESNKSIEQGGLAFYVMDKTKKLFLPMRADRSFKPFRPLNWIPEMCKEIVENPRPWMRALNEIIEFEPHHRAIIWICTLNGKGGVGKSLYNTWLECSGKGVFIGSGTPVQLQEAVICDGESLCYTLDLPKTFAVDNKIGDYINAIEVIKNGFIKTGMHGKRKKLVMNKRPHVIVFSNRLPPYESMTEGRFLCYTINPDMEPGLQCLDPWYQDSPGLPE